MEKEFKELLKASKDFLKDYQSIGNGAKLDCAIKNAERIYNCAKDCGNTQPSGGENEICLNCGSSMVIK